MRVWLLNFLFLYFSFALLGQQYIVDIQHYGVNAGLEHREVVAVFQDRQGFLWLSTPEGLQRYDGYEFRRFGTVDAHHKYNDHYRTIKQDAAGWLWLLRSQKGLVAGKIDLFHPEKQTIHTFEEMFGDSLKFAPSELTWRVIHDAGGNLYFGAVNPGRLIIFDSTRQFRVFNFPQFDILEPIAVGEKGTIWCLANDVKVLELNPSGKVLRQFEAMDKFKINRTAQFHHNFLFYDVGDLSKFFFVQKNGMVDTIDLKDLGIPDLHELEVKSLPYGYFYDENLDAFWIRGYLVSRKSKKLLTKQLLDKNVRAVLKNGPYQYIIGSNYGLYFITLTPKLFEQYLQLKDDNDSVAIATRGLISIGETLYANAEGLGLKAVNLKSGLVSDIKFPTNATMEGWGFRAIGKTADGKLLLNIMNQLTVFDPNAFQVIGQWTSGTDFWDYFEDRNGRVWLVGESSQKVNNPAGSIAFLEENASKISIFSQYNEFTELREGLILNIQTDKKGRVWLCSNRGFYLLDLEEGITARYWSGGKDEFYLPTDNIQHFHEDEAGVFWLATGGAGLIRWDHFSNAPAQNKSNWKQFTIAEGLSNNVIYAVYEDNHEQLWMSSNNGIIQFDKNTFAVKTWLEKYGVTHREFNRTSHWQAEDGTIYLGGLNGVTMFHPDDFQRVELISSKPPQLSITTFQQFDGETNRLRNRTTDLLVSNEIVLHPADRFFNLEFAVLSYEQTPRIQYAWQIEGVLDKWQFQKERSLRFSQLPYGEHLLKIRGQTADGQWLSEDLVIPIRVLKPYYLQTWFIVGVAFLLLGLILGIYRWRTLEMRRRHHFLHKEVQKQTATIRAQAEELRHLDEVKSRFFANVSHELRTPLTLMLGPVSSVLNSGKLDNRNFTLLKKAQQSGQDLLKLVGNILDLSKMDAGKMELNETHITFYPLVKRLVATFESHAERQGIQLLFEYQLPKYLKLELDASKLETIFNNFLSNALKFTPKGGKVKALVTDLAHSIRIEIEDTGRGIHPDDLPNIFNRFYQSTQPDSPTEGGTGIGLAICREFAELMSGRIFAESDLEKGSRFVFEFPKKEVLGAVEGERLTVDGEAEIVPVQTSESTESPSTLNRLPSTVLIVEDNHSLREYLQTILEEKYEVLTAENGKVAWEVLNAAQPPNPLKGELPPPSSEVGSGSPFRGLGGCAEIPSIIISDIMMPEMDGFQLLKKLKNNDAWRHLPVIMLTARADMQDKLRALRIGVDDYLLKPFEEAELLIRIENLLQNYQNRIQFQEDTTAADAPQISEADAEWLEAIEHFVRQNLENENLEITDLADQFAMSKRNLERRLKQLCGLSPRQYITEMRLTEARQWLENRKKNTVSEVAFGVGYGNVKVFSRNFHKRFGRLPSEYL